MKVTFTYSKPVQKLHTKLWTNTQNLGKSNKNTKATKLYKLNDPKYTRNGSISKISPNANMIDIDLPKMVQ